MPLAMFLMTAKGVLGFKNVMDTLKVATPLVSEARKWLETRQKGQREPSGPKPTGDGNISSLTRDVRELQVRLDQATEDRDQQAALISGIVTQVEALSAGLQLVARRMTALLITAAAAILVAVFTLGVTVLSIR